MRNDGKKNLSSQFLEEDGDDSYLDLHFKKENRRSSNDRRKKRTSGSLKRTTTTGNISPRTTCIGDQNGREDGL